MTDGVRVDTNVPEQKNMGLEMEAVPPPTTSAKWEQTCGWGVYSPGVHVCLLIFLRRVEGGGGERKIKIWGNYPQRWKVSQPFGDGLAILSVCFL